MKLDRFWMTLAVSVSVRRVEASGYGWIRPKSEGLRMAGQRKRRKSDAEMRRWPISGRPCPSHSSVHLEKISLSSTGKELPDSPETETWDTIRRTCHQKWGVKYMHTHCTVSYY